VFPAVDAALNAGLPVVWAIHESFDLRIWAYLNWGESGLHPSIRERLLASLAAADTVVFESEATQALYTSQVPAMSGRCIRYGINLADVAAYEAEHDRDALRAQAGFAPQHRVLLCMGVFQERKAQLALVEAFAEVSAAHPAARLVLVGDHPTNYSSGIHHAVDELGLADAVRLEPIAPDTYRWYQCADVLISASDTESLPRSMLESMAFGVPVVAADVFGVGEVVTDGVNGWLFAPRDGAALAAGLRRVLGTSDADLAQLSTRCRKDAETFDGANYATEYAKLIKQLAGSVT
jgi:D-inositol-3-phosphate glycosyltransferase